MPLDFDSGVAHLFSFVTDLRANIVYGNVVKAYNILLFGEPTMSWTLTFNSCASNLFKHFL